MDGNGGRTGDDDIPLNPDRLPGDDGRPARRRRDHPDELTPVKDRKTHDLSGFHARVCSSLGEDDAKLMQRYVPIRIFLQEGVQPAAVERAVARLLTLLHVSIEAVGEPEIGSWFRSLLGITQELTTEPLLNGSMNLAREALLLNSPDGNGRDLGISEAAAAAELIAAIKDEPAAVIQLGSILIVKYRDAQGQTQLVVRSLTKRQMLHIEQDANIVKRPAQLLEIISALSQEDVALPVSERHDDDTWIGSTPRQDR